MVIIEWQKVTDLSGSVLSAGGCLCLSQPAYPDPNLEDFITPAAALPLVSYRRNMNTKAPVGGSGSQLPGRARADAMMSKPPA